MSIGCYMGKISEKIVGWTGQGEKRYNGLAVYPYTEQQEGGYIMVSIFDFLAAVAASVAGYYICKWIDNSHKDS